MTIKIHKTSRSEELAFQLKGGGSSTKTEMERREFHSCQVGKLDFDFGNKIDSFFNGARLTVPIESDAY